MIFTFLKAVEYTNLFRYILYNHPFKRPRLITLLFTEHLRLQTPPFDI
jgi:hypothetical protein